MDRIRGRVSGGAVFRRWGVGRRVLSVLFCALMAMAPGERALGQAVPLVDVTGFEPEIRRQIETARRVAVARPREAEASGRLGMILQAYERYEQAAVFLARAHGLAPGEFRWAFNLGVVRGELGQMAEAVEALRRARELRADHLPTRLRLAEGLLARGEVAASRELYESIRREGVGEASACYGLGRLAALEGKLAEAISLFERALGLYPEYGAAHYAYGMALRDQGRLEEARQHLALSQEHRLKRPLVADPYLTEVAELNLGATLHLTRGRALEAAGRLAESVAEHEQALQSRPGLVQAHINLINLYGRLGKPQQALEHYRAALELSPEMPDLHYNHGVLLVAGGEPRQAAEAFQRVLRLNPFHAEAHHNYGVIIEQEGRLDEAAGHYRAALREKPGYRSAHFHLGRILLNQGKVREGLEQFQQALEPPPPPGDVEAPGYFYALGAAWSMVGDRGQAIAGLREGLRRAAAVGQTDLAAAIRRDLQRLGAE